MSMLHKVESIKDTVKQILMEQPKARDNDRYLMLAVWVRENRDLPTISFKAFAYDFTHGRYSDTESIRRTRQKIQEQYPELRGESYNPRKAIEEPEMREGMPKVIT